jgi:hypothetical protein
MDRNREQLAFIVRASYQVAFAGFFPNRLPVGFARLCAALYADILLTRFFPPSVSYFPYCLFEPPTWQSSWLKG